MTRAWPKLGAYYLIKGDREKAEELSTNRCQSNALMMAAGYLGVKPQE